jgi:putative transposase
MLSNLSRKHRIWFPGAKYHITSRGNRRASIFYDDFDLEAYLDLLEETRIYFPFYLHSYCLMTNHIHLQIETIRHHPKDMMKMLNSSYAMYFNKRHHLVGHVFQGRYGDELIDSKEYMLEVSRYIHMNPVDANMVKTPQEYRGSSYNAYISNVDNPHVTTTKILSFFPEPQKENYRQFVEDAFVFPPPNNIPLKTSKK